MCHSNLRTMTYSTRSSEKRATADEMVTYRTGKHQSGIGSVRRETTIPMKKLQTVVLMRKLDINERKGRRNGRLKGSHQSLARRRRLNASQCTVKHRELSENQHSGCHIISHPFFPYHIFFKECLYQMKRKLEGPLRRYMKCGLQIHILTK